MDEIENQNFSLFFNGTEYLCDFKTIMNHSKSVFDSYNRNGNRTFSLQYEGSPTFFDTISELYSGGEIDVVKSNYDFVKSIASQLQDPSLEKLVEQFETVSSEYENLFSTSTDFEDLKKLENLIYSLSDDNFEESIKLFLGTLLYTNNSHIYTLTQSIFGACISKPYNIDLYIKFISSIIRNKDESNKLETLVYIFIGLLATYNNSRKYFNEIIYILYSMYQNELISPEMQYKTPKIRKLLTNFFQNINEIENKINNERLTFIISAIEKDDENNLQSIISNGNIDINSSLQRPYYIPSNLINNNETLIQICAFFGSYNCFNFLLQNNVEIDEDIIKYAIFGGNEQIINSLIEQNFSFEDDLKLIIKYHRNELFFQIYQPNQRCLKQFEKIARKCITYGNFSLFEFIMKEGLNVNGFYNDGKLLYKAIKLQNMQIVSLLCKISYIDLNIIIDEGNAFLHIAVEKNNIDLVKILLKCKNLNINMYNIYLNVSKKFFRFFWYLF